MNFEYTMQSEIIQSQKDKHCVGVHVYEVSKVVKFTETESGMVVTRGWREGGMGTVVQGYRISVLQNEKFLEMCCTTM